MIWVAGWIERVEDLVIHLATFLVGTLIQYGLDRSSSTSARIAKALENRGGQESHGNSGQNSACSHQGI